MAQTQNIPLDFSQLSSTPSNPSAGYMRIYAKTDGKFYGLLSDGTEKELTQVKTPTFVIDGGGSVIATGEKTTTLLQLPYSGTIIGWYLTSKETATVMIDIWAHDSSDPTNANTITASAKPSLTAAKFNNSTTLTGWTTASAVGKKYKVEVEANDASTNLKLTLLIL